MIKNYKGDGSEAITDYWTKVDKKRIDNYSEVKKL